MKRIALTLIAVAAFMAAHAFDRPRMAAALTYNYASSYDQHGFGLRLQVPVGNHFRIEPEFIYFTQRKEVATLNLNCNLHYVMPMTSQVNIYPYLGFSYSHWGYPGPNANRIGVNIGAGVEYNINARWGVLGEMRGQLMKKESQFVGILGVKYSL